MLIARWNADGRPRLTPFVVVLYALAKTLHAHPRLKRYVTGGRLYQRGGVWLSFTAKRSLEPAAPLVAVKRRFDPDESLEDFARAMEARVRTARVEGDREADREYALLLKIPHPILRRLLALAPWAQSVGPDLSRCVGRRLVHAGIRGRRPPQPGLYVRGRPAAGAPERFARCAYASPHHHAPTFAALATAPITADGREDGAPRPRGRRPRRRDRRRLLPVNLCRP